MPNLKKHISNKKYNSLIFVLLFLCCSFIIGFIGGAFAYNLFFNTSNEKVIVNDSGEVDLKNTSCGHISTAQLVALVENSVVEVDTEIIDPNTQKAAQGAGSGVVLSEDGYIVTNEHVIENAKSIKVKLHNGSEYIAQLIGKDEKEDVAVLKINTSELIPAHFRENAETKVGERVIVIGNPLGALAGSVTDGVISGVDRRLTIDGEEMTLLQTNAEINHGNSGGGMFGEDGQFIGLVVAKSAGEGLEGLGFAIPSNIVKDVIKKLM